LDLDIFAAQIRIKAFEIIGNVNKGHVGGSMSIADAIEVLYGKAMSFDPVNPQWEMRDWLEFSKGHSGPALYAALTIKGFFPEKWLATMNQIGSNLPSHVHMCLTPGVDVSTDPGARLVSSSWISVGG
jgi:transketolase